MAMTLPQKKAPAETAFDEFPAFEFADNRDRGPANAVIARLAAAIAEQNVSKQTEPAVIDSPIRGVPKLQSLLALALGSATLWVAIILAISALV